MLAPNHHAEIARLREENECLREELRQVREALTPTAIEFPVEWHLTPAHRKMLRALYTSKNGTRTQDGLLVSLHGHDYEQCPKLIHTLICQMRKKLSPHGVTIETVRTEGYRLPPASKKIITDFSTFSATTPQPRGAHNSAVTG